MPKDYNSVDQNLEELLDRLSFYFLFVSSTKSRGLVRGCFWLVRSLFWDTPLRALKLLAVLPLRGALKLAVLPLLSETFCKIKESSVASWWWIGEKKNRKNLG